MNDRWLALINPTAGRHQLTKHTVEECLRSRGIAATVVVSSSPAHLATTVSEAAHSGTRRFLSVGGDGTAHHIVNAFGGQIQATSDRFAIAIVAAGSGSDFIRTFGHSRNIEKAFDRLIDPDLYPVDLGTISGAFGTHLFLNAANLGVAAASADLAGRLPSTLGSLRYTAGFWLALASFGSGDVDVDVGRHNFHGEAINVVIANGQFFGGGMNVAPKASTNDNVLDVQVFTGRKRQAFTIMPRVVRGSHLTHSGVRRFLGDTISVSVPGSWPVEADGEALGFGSVEISTIPSAIDFVA
ncbi:MAG: YegS/Rv2252/BmrU family lipid kinase [Actinomycetia bacterium]|nr:YegS/Rv2252/BmrU family lipid kinase [Actinomycetes bacterium]